MPTYEYKCTACGLRFEQQQGMTDESLKYCPECKGELRRLVSGGMGFIFKSEGRESASSLRSFCSLEESGKTCCGRYERCGSDHCGK